MQFFPVRDATLWAAWASIETGDANALPANVFAGPNAPGGVVLTFYQRTKAKERPWFEIADANGTIVRTLRGQVPFDRSDPPKEERAKYYVGNDAGLNRVTWDGSENGPDALARHLVQQRGTGERSGGAPRPLHGAAAR